MVRVLTQYPRLSVPAPVARANDGIRGVPYGVAISVGAGCFLGLVFSMFFNLRRVLMRSVRLFSKDNQALVSVEFALLFPVIIFSSMMLIELIRIAVVIVFVGRTLDNVVQALPSEKAFLSLKEEDKSQWLSHDIVKQSYGMVSIENIDVTFQTFSISSYSKNIKLDDSHSTSMLNISLLLNENFITPLPYFFGLGNSFQHEYRQVVGDLINTSVL